jgi:hypothetical protein
MALFLLCPNLGWIQGQFNFTELSLRYPRLQGKGRPQRSFFGTEVGRNAQHLLRLGRRIRFMQHSNGLRTLAAESRVIATNRQSDSVCCWEDAVNINLWKSHRGRLMRGFVGERFRGNFPERFVDLPKCHDQISIGLAA